MNHKELLTEIYARYNLAEDEPDIVTVVDDINYLLELLGYQPEEEE